MNSSKSHRMLDMNDIDITIEVVLSLNHMSPDHEDTRAALLEALDAAGYQIVPKTPMFNATSTDRDLQS